MYFGETSEEVKQVQKRLLELGFSLPRFGADGVCGSETWEALHQYAKTELGSWEPEVPESVLIALESDPEPVPVPPDPGGDLDGAVILDLRDEQSDPSPKSKVVNGHTVVRNPKSIRGIVLHQTACTYGVSQQQINAAGGDKELALHRRSLNVACHVMAFRDGVTVINNEFERYIYSANGQNAESVSVETEGNYPGLTDEPEKTTWNPPPNVVTDEVVLAARASMHYLVQEARKLGAPLEFVWAHRQSSASRRADPGQELWERVVLQYAVPVLGLKTECGRTWGDGRPIPIEWDPDGVGRY
jgi:hypothetical protein